MNEQNGYSLIEIVITIVFIGIAFPGLIAFFTNTLNDSVVNQVSSQAISLAQSRMEEITADKLDPSRGIDYIRTSGQYPDETIGNYGRRVVVRDSIISGVTGVYVEVETSHAVMVNNYNLSCFFTRY